ncbi:phytosulfokine 4 precursor [Hibiscus trionum]|uniref:Phytosulfokine n=1 Tax=Hibiscus trionum TaxID=183268 RepID=A0A9W7GYW7_HIBTR|nr:phytosulfokine 4 precursor [Hibiscus trionum]
MGKVASLLVLTLLLLSTLSFAARTLPAFSPAKTQVQVTVETEQSSEGVEVEDSCEDECLMRRTLAAHLDYIYTQKQTP